MTTAFLDGNMILPYVFVDFLFGDLTIQVFIYGYLINYISINLLQCQPFQYLGRTCIIS